MNEADGVLQDLTSVHSTDVVEEIQTGEDVKDEKHLLIVTPTGNGMYTAHIPFCILYSALNK